MRRRNLLLGSGAAVTLAACGTTGQRVPSRAQVVVIGGGYGGATAARYVRLLSEGKVDVVLVEPQPRFVSCPVSNLVLSGLRQLSDITSPYDTLVSRHGVTWVRDSASRLDTAAKTVTLAGGSSLRYDTLVVSPGVELLFDEIAGLRAAHASGQVLQAWKAGPETAALRRQLEAMPDGGVYAISVPESPYRCPPGPYERASVIAAYFQRAKPKSKVLILDANPDVTSKPALFKKAWAELYPGMVEYRPLHKVVAVEGQRIRIEVQDDVRADVLNLLPPMRANSIAAESGLMNAGRWCKVDWLTFESTAAKDVHVLGDAVLAAGGMPKSAHMANAHAKVAAAAIVARLRGEPVNPHPMLTNTCYSHVGDTSAIHVASVHEYVAAEATFKPVPGSGGVSVQRNEAEAAFAAGWARNIWADTLG
ncbi:NAD(P)/FAD-dependent oxidoreductase [Piscinibacter gummiphilus]|uniref:NAD(P)/FAD-dependent oxidoreductase n=1 Tax=Piscinibacter gummiphilus TaxID=946333 RepID=A0ABZ0CUR0_9BURK|nr:NAD(P)/FAD-dependent oxidoreductase [Piscinibacter gummiphilus]WOB08704.1 NAD(P)/FAD-dependent oxidoreductase [Piscinibacter gummiphilus]